MIRDNTHKGIKFRKDQTEKAYQNLIHSPLHIYTGPIMPQEQTADYSLLIHHPSPDLQVDTQYMKGREIFSSTMALRDLTQLQPLGFVNGKPILPVHVIKLMQSAIERGSYRVELVDGETEYKLYRKYHDDKAAS